MMLATALRKSILQAAIAGQLTEQRKDDGDARDLLAAIRKEKARLVRAGKLKKERALPEIREDDVPFEVPENWCWARLGSLFQIHSSNRINKADWKTSGIPFIRAREIVELIKTNHLSPTVYIAESLYEQLKETSSVPQKDDILITGVGSIGKVYVVKGTAPFYYKDATVLCLDHNEYFDSQFIKYLLISPYVQHQIFEKSCGTTVNTLTITTATNLVVPVPPLAEQQRIVATIKHLLPELAKLEADEQELDALETAFPARMKSSLLLAAMRGELTEREPGDGDARDLLKTIEREKKRLIKEKRLKREKPLPPVAEEDVPFEIPSNWCWVRLTELGAFSSGKTPNKLDQRNWNNGTYSWITSKDMKKKYLSDSMIHITEFAKNNLREYPAGTMLLVVRSGILKRLLPIAILEKPSTINQDIKAYELFLPKMLDFVYYAIKAFEPMILHDYRKQVTTVDSFKFDEFSKGMPLPLPPLAEQRRIVARLEELLGAVENG